jgi:hypothetical protein
LTHREEDKRVRRGKAAAKGATVIFWRLAGGDEEELLALRVLLVVFVASFLRSNKKEDRGLCRWPPEIQFHINNASVNTPAIAVHYIHRLPCPPLLKKRMPQYIEAAFAPNPQRVKSHIPKYHSSGNGRGTDIINPQPLYCFLIC